MGMFNDTHIGKKIPPTMERYIKEYTTKQDRLKVAKKIGLTDSTLIKVTSRIIGLTALTIPAVEELMKISTKNCKRVIVEAEKATEEIEKMIQDELVA